MVFGEISSDYEDPNATEAIEASDASTGAKLDSEEVRKGRAKEVRELDNSKSKWRSMNQKCDRHRARKSGQNGLRNTKGPKQSGNTMSIVCHGSEHRRIEI